MKLYKNFSLKSNNAFKVEVKAKYFIILKNEEDLSKIIHDPLFKNEKIFVTGDGTNTLFTKDYEGLVIKVDIKGIKIIDESKYYVTIEIGAGENWIKFVEYALQNNWGGIENLSYIPGTVGAAPVQNIAAYGGNFEDVFDSLTAINLETGYEEIFNKEKCKFGYRESFFKKEGKNKYLITRVTLTLLKDKLVDTTYHERYGSINEELLKFANSPYTMRDISRAVIAIRKRKFPDWNKVGTAGSFFLNPIINRKKLFEILNKYPNLQYYPVHRFTYPKPDDPNFKHSKYVKIPAGWLLEELGWKGKRIGDVGTFPAQSLVVVNYGKVTPKEILLFTEKMKEDFYKNFGIELKPEVNII